MKLPSVWLLALLTMCATTQTPLTLAAQETPCDRLNVAIFGADGHHGLFLTQRSLQQEIAYVDDLIAHSAQRERVELARLQQTQAASSSRVVTDYDLKADQALLRAYSTVRAQKAAELHDVAQTIAARLQGLRNLGCRALVSDTKTGTVAGKLVLIPGEWDLCNDVRETLLTHRDDIAVLTATVAFAEQLHNLLSALRLQYFQATGVESSDVSVLLSSHDDNLAKARSKLGNLQVRQAALMGDARSYAQWPCSQRLLAGLQPAPPNTARNPGPASAAQPSIAGNWKARNIGDAGSRPQLYPARINEIDVNGEYWGVIYKVSTDPIHFHGTLKGNMMNYQWYTVGSHGAGSFVYETPNRLQGSPWVLSR
jgi:hypothetical protein